jgi:hypothetical protein
MRVVVTWASLYIQLRRSGGDDVVGRLLAGRMNEERNHEN